MDRVSLLIAIVLAILAIMVGYGIFSSAVDDTGKFVEDHENQFNEPTDFTGCDIQCLERIERVLQRPLSL